MGDRCHLRWGTCPSAAPTPPVTSQQPGGVPLWPISLMAGAFPCGQFHRRRGRGVSPVADQSLQLLPEALLPGWHLQGAPALCLPPCHRQSGECGWSGGARAPPVRRHCSATNCMWSGCGECFINLIREINSTALLCPCRSVVKVGVEPRFPDLSH